MMAGRSSEIDLLKLACTVELAAEKKAQVMQILTQTKINWDRLYQLAERHRLTPFLYHMLQSLPDIPVAFVASLRNSYQIAAADSMIKIHQYRLLDKLLADHGIDNLAFKGIYLAEHCYPAGSLRISGDIDVLVRPADSFKTIQLLKKNGYALNPKQTLYYQDGEERLLTELSEVSLFKLLFNDNYIDIDLHWKLLCFNKDYASFELNDVLLQTNFQTEMQVILLVTHHGVTNIWQQLYYINDLYFLLKGKSIDWPWLMQEMRRYGMERIFLVGLYWCQQLWSLSLPAHIQESVAASDIRTLATTYEKNWETNEPITLSKLVMSQLAYFSGAQTQLSVQVKIYATFVTSRIFRASTFKIGKTLIYIPKELGFITVFIRAIRSFYKFMPASR